MEQLTNFDTKICNIAYYSKYFMNYFIKKNTTMCITGNLILEYRKKHRLTQEQFAKQIGVSIRTIQNYENGAKIPESKMRLFDSLLNIEEYDQTIKNIKIDSDLAEIFTHITDNQLCAYVIMREKELMKNKMFKLFIDKIANEQAFKIIKDL